MAEYIEPVAEAVERTVAARFTPSLITKANGYSFTLKSWVDQMPNLADTEGTFEMPAGYYWTAEEEFVLDPDGSKPFIGRDVIRMTFNVIVEQPVVGKVKPVSRRMAADVVKAIACMNLTVTHVTGQTIARVEPTALVVWNGMVDTKAGAHVAFAVLYRTMENDPFTVG